MISNLLTKLKSVGSQAGFTIVEVATILSAAAILAGTVAPVAEGYIASAKLTRARSDLKVLGTAIHLFRVDTAENNFSKRGAGQGDKTGTSKTVRLLVGNGDTPQVGPGGEADWTATFDGTTVDSFEGHLITNTAGYMTSAGRTSGFAQSSQGGFNAPFAWRGPYMNGPIDADPWGNRYASNVVFFQSYTSNDVILLSAGPDELVNTPFTRDGSIGGGDDIVYVISGGR